MTYTPPTPAEARALMRGLGLTDAQAARLTGLSVESRIFRRYTTDSYSTRRAMPFAVLYVLAVEQARIQPKPETWRDDLARYMRAGDG